MLLDLIIHEHDKTASLLKNFENSLIIYKFFANQGRQDRGIGLYNTCLFSIIIRRFQVKLYLFVSVFGRF